MSSALSDQLRESRAFAVSFSDLRLWSVAAFRRIQWQWPEEYIRPLASAIIRRTDEVDRSEVNLDELQLITIHFDGTLEARSPRSSKGFKGKLFFAEPGEVVYSKIDVRNGAIAIVPEQIPNAVVSSEFPVYRVRREIALPGYIKLLFKTSYFRHSVNGMISGTSGRKRVQPDQLENLDVPLPPLQSQQRILDRWESFSRRVVDCQNLVARLTQRLQEKFLDALGLEIDEKQLASRAFTVLWKDLSRWSVSYNESALRLSSLSEGKYPVVDLGSILELTQYGTSAKAEHSTQGIPILRISNIKDAGIDTADLKYIRITQKSCDSLLLKEGDILIVRTSGSRDLVGTSAVFHEQRDFVFASYLIRLRVQANRANPDFVSWFLNSELGRQQINATSRKIMQNNINAAEIASLLIPLPPLAVQNKIVHRIEEDRQKIAEARLRSHQLRSQIEREVDEIILGIRVVTDGRQHLEDSRG